MPQRLFIAIDLPGTVRHALARLVADAPRGARPVPSGQIHLTLHFLGDVADDVRERLMAALRRVQHPAFAITIQGSGLFPHRGRPAVLWAGVAASSLLTDLHVAIGHAVESCGCSIERRDYVPHVTLARLSGGVSRAWIADILRHTGDTICVAVPVDRFHLYSSVRRDGCTEHSIEMTFPLVDSHASLA